MKRLIIWAVIIILVLLLVWHFKGAESFTSAWSSLSTKATFVPARKESLNVPSTVGTFDDMYEHMDGRPVGSNTMWEDYQHPTSLPI